MTHGEKKKQKMLEIGLEIMRDDPEKLSARAIGKQLGMTHSAVLYHWGTSQALKDAVASYAVKMKDSRIMLYLIGTRHHAVATLSDAQRSAVIDQRLSEITP